MAIDVIPLDPNGMPDHENPAIRVAETGGNAADPMAWSIPLMIRDHSLGVLRFTPSKDGVLDRWTVEDLARRMATAIDAANLYAKAQKAIAVRDEFLSIASHELRTPLTPLKMQTQSLIRSLQSDRERDSAAAFEERMLRMLQGSDRQIERLSRLIDDLLDVSRITMGRLSLNPEDFDFAEVLRELVERYTKPTARQATVNSPATLPVHLDRLRIEQVVINLLTNALKYSEGPVEVLASQHGGMFTFSVSDHGPGIAAEDHVRIFERFERAKPGEHVGGLGLGLFIVGEIVRAHHGTVAVESKLGDGAKFLVTLPLRLDSKSD